ncbi:MAG: hypothetical protein QOD00_1812 [Blastocatellia bacterium]|nr:hypothetical protein [Blastocatellia bacterium]
MTGVELKIATASLMAALKMRDEGTHDHSERAARVSALLGQRMRLDAAQRSALYYGAILHDIGKISIFDHILKKEGPHTSAECLHMRRHVRAGADALSSLGFPSEIIATVLEHHERVDGRGYPFGLKDTEISLLARIVSVADTFDAITHTRCYRAGRSYQAAVLVLERERGRQLDAGVVEAFLAIDPEELRRAAWAESGR